MISKIWIYVHLYMCMCVYINKRLCKYICMYMYICVYVYTHIYTCFLPLPPERIDPYLRRLFAHLTFSPRNLLPGLVSSGRLWALCDRGSSKRGSNPLQVEQARIIAFDKNHFWIRAGSLFLYFYWHDEIYVCVVGRAVLKTIKIIEVLWKFIFIRLNTWFTYLS